MREHAPGMHVMEFALGAIITLVALFDVFQTIILPRPTPASLRPSGALIGTLWSVTRAVAAKLRSSDHRELVLGTFAPFVVVLQLAAWIAFLILGYGLMLDAVSDTIRPHPDSVGTSLYFSGVALFTLGFGDYVATGPLARTLVLLEAASGLGTVALVITFLFTLFAEYQRRETLVITLSVRAGAPPSGLTLLELYAKFGMVDQLSSVFAGWEEWSANVLDSHLSYPVLAFFRSTHDNQSWISALGAVLDAAILVLTTIEGGPTGPAWFMRNVGIHLIEDLAQYFRMENSNDPYVERSEFHEAYGRLAVAGYHVRAEDEAWAAFATMRAEYAAPLNAMARQWVTPPALWVGDRSRLRPHGRELLARPAAAPATTEGRQ